MSAHLAEITNTQNVIDTTAGAAAQTTIESTVTSLNSAQGIKYTVKMGAIASTAVTSLKIQLASDLLFTTAQDLAGSSFVIADDDDGKTFVLDAWQAGDDPPLPFARLVVLRGTADATVESAFSETYGLDEMPSDNSDAEVKLVTFETPGTP